MEHGLPLHTTPGDGAIATELPFTGKPSAVLLWTKINVNLKSQEPPFMFSLFFPVFLPLPS
jgi:hypothetical protein